MIEILAPLRATAHRCGLVWADPFILYKADKLETGELEAASADYVQALQRWIDESSEDQQRVA